jgi:hypothetical protein
VLKWTPYWVSAFEHGPHVDGRRDGEWVARVVKCRRVEGLPVMPHLSGRRRQLYLSLVDGGRGWHAVGVYATAHRARSECAKSLGEVAQ